MKRINDRTVELTEREALVQTTFDYLLAEGLGITDAAIRALRQHAVTKPRDAAFIEYLSEGTVVAHCGRLHVKREHRLTSTTNAPSADEMRLRLGLA